MKRRKPCVRSWIKSNPLNVDQFSGALLLQDIWLCVGGVCAGHVVRAFVDVIQSVEGSGRQKKVPVRLTDRAQPSTPPGAHSPRFGLDAAGSRSGSFTWILLSAAVRGSPRRFESEAAGLGDGGWVRAVSRLVLRGGGGVGVGACSPRPCFALLSWASCCSPPPGFLVVFSSLFLLSFTMKIWSSDALGPVFGHGGEKENLNGFWLQQLNIPRFSLVRFCIEDFLKDSRRKRFCFLSFFILLFTFFSLFLLRVPPPFSPACPCLYLCLWTSLLLYFSLFFLYPPLSLTSTLPSICLSPSSIMAPRCRFSWSCCLLVLLVLPAVQSSFTRSGGGSSAECGPGKGPDCPGETPAACLHLNTSQVTSDRWVWRWWLRRRMWRSEVTVVISRWMWSHLSSVTRLCVVMTTGG